MEKQRLELFSDGVFAIVLTLLVLGLRVPDGHGVAGLQEIGPALIVHAASFFLVGVFWMVHHAGLARVEEVTSTTLLLNLCSLFWLTLIPFGAENAAQRPLEPLGACVIDVCTGACLLFGVATRRSAHASVDADPQMRALLRKYGRRLQVIAAANLLCAVLSFISPWIGYAASVATVTVLMLGPARGWKSFRDENKAVGREKI